MFMTALFIYLYFTVKHCTPVKNNGNFSSKWVSCVGPRGISVASSDCRREGTVQVHSRDSGLLQ